MRVSLGWERGQVECLHVSTVYSRSKHEIFKTLSCHPFTPSPILQADPCPFFIKAGFCPRKPLCKLDHTMPSGHTHPQPASQSNAAMLASSPTKSPTRGDRRENLARYLGSPKRFHPSDQDNDTLKGSLKVPRTTASNLGDGGGGRGGGRVGQFKPGNSRGNRVGYFRSLSSPADSLNFGHMVDFKSSEQSPDQGQRSTSTELEGVVRMPVGEVNQMTKEASESAKKEEALDAGDKQNASSQTPPTQVPVSESNTLAKRAAKHVEFEDEQQALVGGKTLNSVSGVSEMERVDATAVGSKCTEEAGSTLNTMDTFRTIPKPPELPEMFNFSEMSRKITDKDALVKEKEMQQGKGPPEGDKDNVFVFSASSPASPPHVSGKRKNAVVRFSLSGGSEEESREGGSCEGEGAEGAEEMALLAQQLDLESDTVRCVAVSVVEVIYSLIFSFSVDSGI